MTSTSGKRVNFKIFMVAVFLSIGFFACGYLWMEQLHMRPKRVRAYPRSITPSNEVDPWREIPSLELVIRTNSEEKFIRLYLTWFLKSLKLFWPEHRQNVTLVLDDENKQDHDTGTRLSQKWPYPKVFYRKPGDTSIYTNDQRRRMFLSYFYPEEYASAEYVGFVDTDTMFTTVVTPKMLFVNGKPTVQARIGQPFYQQALECWSDVTEYFVGKKEALQCMTYFPVIFKVQHVVEFRRVAEKRFGKPFLQIFKKSFLNWTGDRRRESQQSLEYFRSIDASLLIPKPRVAIHARHYMEHGSYITTYDDMTKNP